MINLLSSFAKRQLWNEYRMRLGVVILLAVFVLEFFTLALFFPAYLTLRGTTNEVAASLEQERALVPASDKAIHEEVKALKNDLTLLTPGDKPQDQVPSALLTDILKVKPQGITINNLAYLRSGDTVSLQFSGVAATRDDILAFKNSLSQNPLYTLARTNDYLIKKTNITFSITLTMK
jgi:Tfp pilus assembly protein PilN